MNPICCVWPDLALFVPINRKLLVIASMEEILHFNCVLDLYSKLRLIGTPVNRNNRLIGTIPLNKISHRANTKIGFKIGARSIGKFLSIRINSNILNQF